MRLGDPMLVCLGVVARGGGKRGVLRMCNVSSTSGAEPGETHQLRFLRKPGNADYVLSCKSIAFELEVPPAAFLGE